MSDPVLPWDSSSKMGTERTPGDSLPGFSPGHSTTACWTTMACIGKQKYPWLPSGNPASVTCMSSLCLSFPICLVGALVGSNQATPIELLSWGLDICLRRLPCAVATYLQVLDGDLVLGGV